MVDFWERKYDVLVSTTIIESGLDIPNSNTLLIDRADMDGLSQRCGPECPANLCAWTAAPASRTDPAKMSAASCSGWSPGPVS